MCALIPADGGETRVLPPIMAGLDPLLPRCDHPLRHVSIRSLTTPGHSDGALSLDRRAEAGAAVLVDQREGK
jgi:hypothetical protein